VTVLATASWLVDVGRSLREAFFMFWVTLWPLILGFGLSGAVQAFVSRDAMKRSLGELRPGSVGRASLYGMASSSCSYAASAMAKSLFVKGADFVAANVFMFASTNLVVELGIVLIVLIGWQFAAAELVGGVVMIALFSVLGGLWLRGRHVVEARERLRAGQRPDDHPHGPAEDPMLQRQRWRVRLRSKSGWADAATYTMTDLTMLRTELVIGYVVAGFLTVLVPVHVWNALFLEGHGFWTTLENVVIGPFIAIISFVCSVGNVPLAAALWHGGIAFGGVISFIFADLIAIPLLLIYRRYYGTALMLRMLGLFWLVMSAAGLVTEGLFRAAGLVPTDRSTQILTTTHIQWNATTVLNIIFLGAFGLLYLTYRNRGRLRGGHGYAIDPVCGMQVQSAWAPARAHHGSQEVVFCSDRCRVRFQQAPGRYADEAVSAGPRSSKLADPPADLPLLDELTS
jgi:uncharacterized protein